MAVGGNRTEAGLSSGQQTAGESPTNCSEIDRWPRRPGRTVGRGRPFFPFHAAAGSRPVWDAPVPSQARRARRAVTPRRPAGRARRQPWTLTARRSPAPTPTARRSPGMRPAKRARPGAPGAVRRIPPCAPSARAARRSGPPGDRGTPRRGAPAGCRRPERRVPAIHRVSDQPGKKIISAHPTMARPRG